MDAAGSVLTDAAAEFVEGKGALDEAEDEIFILTITASSMIVSPALGDEKLGKGIDI